MEKIGLPGFTENPEMGVAGDPESAMETVDRQIKLRLAHPATVVGHEQLHDFVDQALFGAAVVSQPKISGAKTAKNEGENENLSYRRKKRPARGILRSKGVFLIRPHAAGSTANARG
jgi:hypothetical protein